MGNRTVETEQLTVAIDFHTKEINTMESNACPLMKEWM